MNRDDMTAAMEIDRDLEVIDVAARHMARRAIMQHRDRPGLGQHRRPHMQPPPAETEPIKVTHQRQVAQSRTPVTQRPEVAARQGILAREAKGSCLDRIKHRRKP